MFIGVLSFTLLIGGAESIKDKRRVVNSVNAKLHREHQVSVAEVGNLDRMDAAFMALAMVNRDRRYLMGVLDRIQDKLASLGDAELRDCSRTILNPDDTPEAYLTDDGQPLWTEDERRE
jgi:uncharacterized protein YlxP (DUF503 family)